MAPDTVSRICCASLSRSSLYDIYSAMCHPGITRMYHYVIFKHLPYSLDDVRQITSRCKICAKIKPRFLKSSYMSLAKATQPMERLSIDFRAPYHLESKISIYLTVVDEYSRYPFAFPCCNIILQL